MAYVPDHFKTEKMCNDAAEKDPYRLGDILAYYRTAGVCKNIVEPCPDALMHVPDGLKTARMCEGAIEADP